MLCHQLELTVELDPSWPKERLGELYTFITTRLTVASDKAQREMKEAGFKSLWLESVQSTIRIRDTHHNVDVICRFGEKPKSDIDPRHRLLGGAPIYRPDAALALISLPKTMWAMITDEPSPCACPWCAGADSYLDTLVVDCKPEQRPDAHHRAWLTHAPIYHRSLARVVITIEEPAKYDSAWISAFYGAAVEAQVRKSNTTYPVGPQAHTLFGVDWLWQKKELHRRILVEMLDQEWFPLELPTASEIWRRCRQDEFDMIVTLPREMWTPLDGNSAPCNCCECTEGGLRSGNALRLKMEPSRDTLDIAELTHESARY